MSDIITIKGLDNILDWVVKNGGLPKGARLFIKGRELVLCDVNKIWFDECADNE